jgi:molybdate transport system ATP-binding protein
MSAPLFLQARLKGRLGAFQLDAAFDAPLQGVTVIMGPSGSGKTSLLRGLAGLARMQAVVKVGDEIWQDSRRFVPPHLRSVGMVFQDARLLPHLSVHGNLMFGAKRAGSATGPGPDDVIDMLALRPLLERHVAGLSGGEQQRVSIGRALLSRPRLMLMDEPTSGLDADARAQVLACVADLPRKLGVPVIYVTHDPVEAALLGDTRVRMQTGRVLDVSPRRQVEQDLDATFLAITPAMRDRLALAALRAGLPPLDRFSTKWIPVVGQDARKNKKIELRPDAIWSEKALVDRQYDM